jgi:DNA-directed RNA polymerase specialized sigma24 family protein
VQDISALIDAITTPAATQAQRHEAFAGIVARFQNMAYGCAYAVLGDAWLAEDVAQEAFIVAWQKLPQLRTPEAFPGWLRRIVLTQCNRLTAANDSIRAAGSRSTSYVDDIQPAGSLRTQRPEKASD